MIKSILANKRVGSRVCFKYPTHGKLNILRNVRGVIEAKGSGPLGPYVTVREDDERVTEPHNFSACKIVEM